MIRKLSLISLFLVFFLVLTTIAWATKIIEVSVTGNKTVDSFYIKEVSRLKVGDELTPSKVKDAIKKLYNLERFDDIVIEQQETDDGILIRINVKERPLVGKLQIKGIKKFDEVDLWKEIPHYNGQPYSEINTHKSVRNIKEMYKEKGYYLVEVDVKVKKIENMENKVEVIYQINEGEKVKVKKINFHNNRRFTDKKLRDKMQDTKESHWWNSSEFIQEKLDADLQLVLDFYREKGYINAEISDYQVNYSDNKSDLFIEITVEEGEKFYVGTVDFEGNEVFESDFLRKQLKFEENKRYNQKKIDETLENLYSTYAEDGYIFCNIYPDTEIEDKKVNITYKINESDQATVNEVVILGNTKTYEKIIRRQISIFPDDVFRRSKIMRTQRDLMQLGYFDENEFNFDIRPAASGEEGKIDLLFDLTEKRTGNVSLGAGYSSQEKLTGFLELSENNLLGRGQRVNLRWEFGKVTQEYELGFTEPWLFDTPTSAGGSVFHTSTDRGDYIEKNSGGSLQIGRPLPWLDYTSVYARYTLENVDIELEDDYVPTSSYDLTTWDGPVLTSSIRLSVSRNSSNDVYNPTRGSKTSLSLEYAGGDILRGDVKLQKYIAESTWYYPGLWKMGLSLGTKFGYVNGLNTPSEVPIYERFELGGMITNRVRGYTDYSIIPEGNSYREGGRVMNTITAEAKIPVVPNQVYLLGFLEAGNTWNSLRETDLGNLKRSAGMGIRVITPMGPLGFDYGYGFDRAGGGNWEPHFIFGAFF